MLRAILLLLRFPFSKMGRSLTRKRSIHHCILYPRIETFSTLIEVVPKKHYLNITKSY